MAPHSPDDDDFITTISDHDEVPNEESDSDSAPLALKPKRKRDALLDDEVTSKHSKRPKNGSKTSERLPKGGAGLVSKTVKGQGNTEELDLDSDAGGAASAHRVEDDGAMDSEFEFEVGGMGSGAIEEFDGWDLEPTSAQAANGKRPAAAGGDRKGVNIDDLVAARRALKANKKQAGQKAVPEEDDSSGDDEEDMMSDNFEDGDGGIILEGGDDDEDEDESLAADAFGMGASLGDEESGQDEDAPGSNESEADSAASPMPHPDDMHSPATDDEDDDPEERAREEAFFAPEPARIASKTPTSRSSFQSMSLSRPILRGLASVNFSEPTPIQAKTIPVALLGKDVVGGAVTGSGKTAAFMIPILERLLYRPRKVPTTRVVILMPTRELAVQCHNVSRKLASYTDITFAQIVGGFSLREQENVLRRRPDVVIATPGRFIDHMRNSAAFATDAVEILVLDEADRMLEDGFADELNEILTTIPQSRQTMLFSATMTSRVDQLIRAGLQRPVRLLVDAQRQTVGSLLQEFVRLRPGREDKRLAYLMQLVSTVYTSRCIIFFRQKKQAHRVRVIFSLCDIKAAELHGSMSQEQRLAAVEAFRSGTATHLLATDVASRGLDIRGVEVVLNYEAPQTHAIYLHRVGRTARMGRQGRACTLAAEEDRKVVREVVKGAKIQGARVVSRTVDAAAAGNWAEKLDALEGEVQAILEDEQEARAMAQADMQLRKGENLLEHADEIAARPKRTWFATETQKAAAKRAGRAVLNGPEDEKRLVIVGKKASNKDRKRADAHQERSEGAVKLFKKGKEDRTARKGGASRGGKGATAKGKASGKKGGRADERHRKKMQVGKGKKGRR
jgi:ATP-dependent RNA helicase DDX27